VCAVAYPDDIHAEPVKVKTILTDYKDYEVGKSTMLSDFFCALLRLILMSQHGLNQN